MPGQRQAFQDYIRKGFETGAPALKAFGFTRITSFTTPEVTDDDGGLLVTIYEANDASVVEKFYGMQAVIDQEAKAHGVMVVPHNHDSLPTNTPFLELELG
jgi:hypothetical protein